MCLSDQLEPSKCLTKDQLRELFLILVIYEITTVIVAVNFHNFHSDNNNVYKNIVSLVTAASEGIHLKPFIFVPISTLESDNSNIYHHSDKFPWYQGPPLYFIVDNIIPTNRTLSNICVTIKLY